MRGSIWLFRQKNDEESIEFAWLFMPTAANCESTDQEQQLWSECSRLLTNCIIYYNACILSELLERAERRQDYQPTDAASWKHVNLYGGLQLPGYRRWGRPPGIGQSLGGGPR